MVTGQGLTPMVRSSQEAPGTTEATKASTQGRCTATGDPPRLEGSVKDTIQVKFLIKETIECYISIKFTNTLFILLGIVIRLSVLMRPFRGVWYNQF